MNQNNSQDAIVNDNAELTAEELAAIEREYDESTNTRPVTEKAGLILRIIALTFAGYHYFTAGFGLPAYHWHMGWHLCGLFILTYAFFPIFKTSSLYEYKKSAFRIGNIPIYDLLLIISKKICGLAMGQGSTKAAAAAGPGHGQMALEAKPGARPWGP